jgi:hypothetical protein
MIFYFLGLLFLRFAVRLQERGQINACRSKTKVEATLHLSGMVAPIFPGATFAVLNRMPGGRGRAPPVPGAACL